MSLLLQETFKFSGIFREEIKKYFALDFCCTTITIAKKIDEETKRERARVSCGVSVARCSECHISLSFPSVPYVTRVRRRNDGAACLVSGPFNVSSHNSVMMV